MHSKQWLLTLIDLMRVSSGSNNVGNFGVSFGQVGREIHFFPPKFFFDFESRESKLRTQIISLDKI
jgi:hypothetical protein